MIEKRPYIINGKRATLEEYRKIKYEDLRVRVLKGKKELVVNHAEMLGESINAFINRAISETIDRDNQSSKGNV